LISLNDIALPEWSIEGEANMEQSRRCSGRDRGPELGDTVPLEDVRAEIEEIEGIAEAIGGLTALLRARLTPEHFRLVWELQDAVECLGLAERQLLERRLADELAHHLPRSSAAMRVLRRHLPGDELAIDGTG